MSYSQVLTELNALKTKLIEQRAEDTKQALRDKMRTANDAICLYLEKLLDAVESCPTHELTESILISINYELTKI